MNEIFIVLIRAHTGLGSFARLFSDYEYTHAAVSFDRKLTDFVSYSRRYHSFPFDAGFTHEYRDYYAFGKHRNVKVKIFRLTPDDAHMQKIRAFIQRCENDHDEIFNLFSMATMPLLHGFRIYKAHNCMSFAAKIAALSGCVRMQKPYFRYSIPELDALLMPFFYAEGNLPRKSSAAYHAYMRPFAPCKYCADMSSLLAQLTYRLTLPCRTNGWDDT